MDKVSYSIEETQMKTGICRGKIYLALGQGQLKAKKFGRRTIILHDDLMAFLSSLDSYPSDNKEA